MLFVVRILLKGVFVLDLLKVNYFGWKFAFQIVIYAVTETNSCADPGGAGSTVA